MPHLSKQFLGTEMHVLLGCYEFLHILSFLFCHCKITNTGGLFQISGINVTDVCQAIQQCSSLGNALQLPSHPPVGYVADATETIDYPKHHTRHITKEQTKEPTILSEDMMFGN